MKIKDEIWGALAVTLSKHDNGYIRHKLYGEYEESELVFLVSCVPLLMNRIVELEQELAETQQLSVSFGQYLADVEKANGETK